MTEKQALRRFISSMWVSIIPDAREKNDEAVRQNILSSDAYRLSDTVLLYAAIHKEIDLSPVARQAIADGKTIGYPKVEGDGIMHFYKVNSPEELVPGAMHIPEPPTHTRIISHTPTTLMLIPAVAFDKHGYRLGRGGGYYDRYLCDFNGVRMGVAGEACLYDTLPHEAHDMTVDAIVTERKIYRVKL